MGCMRALTRILAAGLLACAIAAGAALAYSPVGSDFRISNVGAANDADRDAFNSAVAYNSTNDEYLVVWQGDGLGTNDEVEIFGQRVSASGTELGSDFRISNVGTDMDQLRDAFAPSVAYNPATNQYLVAWEADGLVATDDEFEIFGQRVSATGAEVGSDFRISEAGADLDATRNAFEAAVTYNSMADQFLVVWSEDGDGTDEEYEIFGQRLNATGAELGSDFRISNTTDVAASRAAFTPAVAYETAANEYLVVWVGDGLLATDDEFEVFGQRVSASGTEVGSDFRISSVGMETATSPGADTPSVAYGATPNQYLVTWHGDGLATDNKFEIFGQRVSPTGTEVGSDFRISNTGTDGDAGRDAVVATVAYSSDANEYLAVWEADGLATDNEDEIFGQRLSAAGAAIGADFRISNVGSDTDIAREARRASLAYNPTADEYLVAWEGDGLTTDDEFEIFGQRLAQIAPSARCGGRQATVVGTSGRDVIPGTAAADVIATLGGNDVVRGLGRKDLVCGGPGNDSLIGGAGNDSLIGGSGKDLLKGGPGRDRLLGQGGRDRLVGGGARDVCKGGPGRDVQRAC